MVVELYSEIGRTTISAMIISFKLYKLGICEHASNKCPNHGLVVYRFHIESVLIGH